VEGVSPEDACSRVDRGLQAGLAGRIGPRVVSMVENGGDAAVQSLIDAGDLANVDVLGRVVELCGAKLAVSVKV